MADESNVAVLPTPAARVRPPAGEVVIELGTKQNQKVLFHPTGESFRGRWSDAMMKGNSSVNFPELQSLPEIPGIHISLNGREKVGKVFDPLAEAQYKPLVLKLQAIGKKIDGVSGSPVLAPDGPSSRQTDLNDSQVKTWYYWMKMLVEVGHAVLRKGTLPSFEEIAEFEGGTNIGSREGGNNKLTTLEGLQKHRAKGE